MTKRYDVLAARTYTSGGEERTHWTRVGVAFESRDGEGIDITLHAVPVPQGDTIRLVVRQPREREQQTEQPRQREQAQHQQRRSNPYR